MSGRSGDSRVCLDELTSAEFARRSKERLLAIVPIGSLEEHGPHLPLGTDSMQAEEVVRRVALEFDCVVCPPVRYGECRSTRNFPGTVSLRSETMHALAYDIISELARNGVRNVLLISGHAGSGHMAALRLAAQRCVEARPSLKVMVLSDYDIAYDLKGKEFPEDDGHAGMIETSRMLAIRPELVGKDRPRGQSRPPRFMVVADPERYFPSGVMGDARGSSAARGKRIDDHVVDKLCALIEDGFGLKRKRGKR